MNEDHWNHVYAGSRSEDLGWYEPELAQSLRLIDRCGLTGDDLILDVGCGTSSLISSLIERGFKNLVGVDHSSEALTLAAHGLPTSQASLVQWIQDDLTDSQELANLSGVRLWHDRAVLHFLTSERERVSYRSVLTQILDPSGFVIIAVFSLRGVHMCSGLRVLNHDADSLSAFLGADFELVESFDHVHATPGGEERPYVYTLFKRAAS